MEARVSRGSRGGGQRRQYRSCHTASASLASELFVNSDKEIKKSRSEYFVGDIDPVIGFANVYNRFYRGWLAHKKAVGGYVLRYEDVVEDGSKTLNKLFSSQFKIAELSSGFASLPMSVQMGADD